MQTKLLLFYGPGSGSGKSTLSRIIHDALQQTGVKTKYIAESDVLHLGAFAPYVKAVKQDNPGDIKVLLSSYEHFIGVPNQSNQMYTEDSSFPYSQGEYNEQDFSGSRIFDGFNSDRLFAR